MKAEDARRRIWRRCPGSRMPGRASRERARDREPARHVAQHDSAHQRDARAFRRPHRSLEGGVQQRSGQPAVSAHHGLRRHFPQRHRRRGVRRTRCARGCCGSSRRAAASSASTVPWASRNWTEFTELIGAMDAPHRIEQGILRVYDRTSPLVAPLGSGDLPFREEHLPVPRRGRPPAALEQRARAADGRARQPSRRATAMGRLHRPDGIYPVSWIRTSAAGASSTRRSDTCPKRS